MRLFKVILTFNASRLKNKSWKKNYLFFYFEKGKNDLIMRYGVECLVQLICS